MSYFLSFSFCLFILFSIDVEFGSKDGLHGVAKSAVYVIYTGNLISSLFLCVVSTVGLAGHNLGVAYVAALAYAVVVILQSAISIIQVRRSYNLNRF